MCCLQDVETMYSKSLTTKCLETGMLMASALIVAVDGWGSNCEVDGERTGDETLLGDGLANGEFELVDVMAAKRGSAPIGRAVSFRARRRAVRPAIESGAKWYTCNRELGHLRLRKS